MSIPCPQRDSIEHVLQQGGYDPSSRVSRPAPRRLLVSGADRVLHLQGISLGTNMRGPWAWMNVAVFSEADPPALLDTSEEVGASVVVESGEANRRTVRLLAFDDSDRVTMTNHASSYASIV